ncbi:MAG: GNAT family N-acetyltransferase [Mycobacteriales bacterium]
MAGEKLRTRSRNSDRAGNTLVGPFRAHLPSTLGKIVELRRVVWRNEPAVISADILDPDAAMLHDAYEANAQHWIFTLEESVVAAARLSLSHDEAELPDWDRFHHLLGDIPRPVAMLSRLVVHPTLRDRGLARALTDVRIETARAWGAGSIVSEAAPERARQLRELGFDERGQTPSQPWDLAPFTLMVLACQNP